MSERWAPIKDFEELYEVSTEGRVRAIDKRQRYLLRTGAEAYRFVPGHEISRQKNNRGYLIVHLYKSNVRHMRTVHRQVALAFLPQTAPEVNHKNHDRADARLENLEWCTRAENLRGRRTCPA
jgi:hypothetical protein